MNSLYLATSLLVAAQQVDALFTLSTNSSDERIMTTRYSHLMGSFSEADCLLNASGILLEQDGCNRSRVTQDIQDKIVFIENSGLLSCYEETLYANLEDLGAVAVIHFDNFPPGTRINKVNLGKHLNAGSIPFLDAGNLLDVSLLLQDSDLTVFLESCETENPFKVCKRPATGLLDLLGLVSHFFGFYMTMKALEDTEEDEGTKPRRFVLKVQGVNFAIAGLRYGVGLGSYSSYFWMTGVMPMGVQYIFFAFGASFSYYIIGLCTAYWYFLSSQLNFAKRCQIKTNCFMKHQTTTRFFETNEFMYSSLIFPFSFILISIGYLQPQPEIAGLALLLGLAGFILLALFTIVNYKLNRTMMDMMWNSSDVSMRVSKIELLTGQGVKRLLSKEETKLTSVSVFVLKLQLHLGRWLQVALVGKLGVTVFLVFYTLVFPTEGADFESPFIQKCIFLLPQSGIAVSNAMIELALVKGIQGPGRQVEETIPSRVGQNDVVYTSI